MTHTRIRADETQKTSEAVHPLRQAFVRQQTPGIRQATAAVTSSRGAQVNRTGLGPAGLLALQRSAGNQAVVGLIQRFAVYRGGPHEAANYVPRKGTDTTGPKRGLSTFEVIADIPAQYRPAQQIETDSLAAADLEAVRNGAGKNSHVSIVPTDDLPAPVAAASAKKAKPKATYPKLTEWAEGGATHAYTIGVMDARIGEAT